MPKHYLDLEGLTRYDGKIKNLISSKADAAATEAALSTLTSNLSTEASTRADADTALAGRISTLENAGYITKAVDNLVNYYTKSNTYNKTEVNSLISAIKTIHFEVVQTLPEQGESNIIYLVPHSHGTGDSYDEYAWVSVSGTYQWEKIGNTDIDLSNYVQKTFTVNGKALNGSGITLVAADIADVYSKTQVDTELAKKVDKVSGKGLSTNDYTTAEKTKLGNIETEAQKNKIEKILVNSVEQTVSEQKAVDLAVPTKVSDLSNDSGFITGVDSITSSEIDALFTQA